MNDRTANNKSLTLIEAGAQIDIFVFVFVFFPGYVDWDQLHFTVVTCRRE